MKTKKLNLNDLKIDSFITSLEEKNSQTVKGGNMSQVTLTGPNGPTANVDACPNTATQGVQCMCFTHLSGCQATAQFCG